MIVFLQKKQKRNFIQKTKKNKYKKTIPKISKRFLSSFCYWSEIWHSIFELISALDILHMFFLIFRIGALGAQ